MKNNLLNELDIAIEDSIKKFRNAKTGTEIRVFISEYEELMFKRERVFTQLVMDEGKLMREYQEVEKSLQLAQNAKKRAEKSNRFQIAVVIFVAFCVTLIAIKFIFQ